MVNQSVIGAGAERFEYCGPLPPLERADIVLSPGGTWVFEAIQARFGTAVCLAPSTLEMLLGNRSSDGWKHVGSYRCPVTYNIVVMLRRLRSHSAPSWKF